MRKISLALILAVWLTPLPQTQAATAQVTRLATADATQIDGGVIRFTGNVIVTFPGSATLTADEMVMNSHDEAMLRGNVRLRLPSRSK